MTGRSLLATSLLFACHGKDEPKDDGPTGTTDTSVPTVSWSLALPQVDATQLERGYPAELQVRKAPPGSTVELWMSDLGMEEVCDAYTFECLGLIAPALVGTLVADEAGTGVLPFDVAPDDPMVARFYRGFVTDPATGASTWTDPIQRDVQEDHEATPLSFRRWWDRGGFPAIRTTGNSHTGGVAWIDYDGDYWADLFVSNGLGEPHFLFHNDGDGTFTDRSQVIPKPGGNGMEDAGGWFADVDNDGDLDLLVIGDSGVPLDPFLPQPREGGPNLLYVNRGDGTFTEQGQRAGVRDPDGARNITAAFADFDRDGWVDLYIGQWTVLSEANDDYDRLLRNRGDGTFEDVTAATGVDGLGLDALTAAWVDLERDGWPDLYVGNISHLNEPPVNIPDDVIYHNVDGETFTRVRDTQPWFGDDAWAAMGIDAGDIDNDGDWDLYVADWWPTHPLPYGNAMYVNEGDGTFSDNVCADYGTCTGYTGWPVVFADFDLDGWVDLYVGTNLSNQPDMMYHNDRTGRFVNAGVPGMFGNAARGGAQSDFDGDGMVDLAIWTLNGEPRLLRNESQSFGHWLELKLVGRSSSRDAIGAEVSVITDQYTMIRRVSGGDSAHSQSDLVLHVGTSQDDLVDLEIRWPKGPMTRLVDVPTDQFLLIDQAVGIVPEVPELAIATWNAAASSVDVQLRTTWRGRTAPVVDGVALDWDPEQTLWVGAIPFVSEPTEVLVDTPRASFPIPLSP